jgi:hypothetical protein
VPRPPINEVKSSCVADNDYIHISVISRADYQVGRTRQHTATNANPELDTDVRQSARASRRQVRDWRTVETPLVLENSFATDYAEFTEIDLRPNSHSDYMILETDVILNQVGRIEKSFEQWRAEDTPIANFIGKICRPIAGFFIGLFEFMCSDELS